MSILELVRPWVSTAALLGLCEFARRLWVQNRQLKLAENKDDREGYGSLIATLQGQVDRMDRQLQAANERIGQLEVEKDKERRLVLELLRQLNRTQAASIMAAKDVSPELKRALESTLAGIEGAAQ